jgi:hypothetical protein
MSRQQYQLFVSNRCPNCSRFIGALARLEVAGQVRIVDVDRQPVEGVEAVPTLSDGRATYVGSEAFKWLAQHEADAPLDTISLMGNHGLAFSDISTDGDIEFSEQYSSFQPVE